MCHETTARPPLPPIGGGAGDVPGEPVELTAADGNRFAAYTATTGTPDGAGMVVLPDVRGLHPFYVDLAERFAQAGVHATAIDYFGRTAGVGIRDQGFEFMPHVQQSNPETVALDVGAAVAHVRSEAGGGAGAVFAVGFCFGGRNAFNQAAAGHGLAGVIGFYGMPARRDPTDTNAPIDRVASFECPVLGLFGGADGGIPREAVDAFRQALDDAGVANELVVYDDAPHAFFDRSFDRHKDASDDAWRRTLVFVDRNR